ncbi:zinc finger, CCHC-type containing protein [Tanacetum coccineum]
MAAAAMSVVYVLTTPIPEDGGDDPIVEQVRKRNKWDNDDYVCRGLILKVMEQHNELLGILGRFTQHKINMDEAIQVSCIIDKLLPSWKVFKHTLKHKKEELTLVELGSHLRIEESLRAQDSDKPKGNNVVGPQLNIVNNIGKSAFMSTFKLNDSIIWYVRLGNVHFNNNMQDMSKDGLILVLTWTLKNDEALVKFKVFKTEVELQQGSQIKRFRTDRGELSQGFWGEAMLTACYLLNKVLNKRNRVVGQLFYVIEPNESVSINSIIESRDAIFDENRFLSVPRPSLMIHNRTEDIGGLVVPKVVTDEDDLKTFDEAMKSHDVAFWKEVINDEMDSIIGNNTWVLADLPTGCKPLGCKWIFKRKLKVDGTIEKFKARLVIQGFKQKSGIDYFDTYTPVARISTIRLLIAMASIHSLIIHQMDVKTAFLNDDLDEEVYMNQPQGFIMTGNENKVDLTKEFLSSRFSIKDIGEADVILVSTPMDTCEKLMPNNGHTVSQLEYSRVIGCLMYAMTCTRPDIAFAVGKLSRHTSNPSTQHCWISNTEDNSSTSGWVFLLGGGAVSWASKKQTCITGSTMEYEFVALTAAGKEAEWLKNLFLEISLWSKPIAPISIHCDSTATLAKAYSQMYNGKSRHLGVRHIMIRELITNDVISIEFVRSQQNLAGYLTKGLARYLVIKSAEGMGLKSN